VRWEPWEVSVCPSRSRASTTRPPPQRRVFEHVERLLDGHDAGLVATIALTILTHAIIDMSPDRNLTEIDSAIDGVAVSLKTGVRSQMQWDAKEG